MDRGAWRAAAHGAAKRQTRLSDLACTHARTQTTRTQTLSTAGVGKQTSEKPETLGGSLAC